MSDTLMTNDFNNCILGGGAVERGYFWSFDRSGGGVMMLLSGQPDKDTSCTACALPHSAKANVKLEMVTCFTNTTTAYSHPDGIEHCVAMLSHRWNEKLARKP